MEPLPVDPLLVVGIAATLIIGMSVLLHYETLAWLNGRLAHTTVPPRARVLVTILSIVGLHNLEILVFAVGYYLLLAQPVFGALAGADASSFVDCGYYSAVVFTTLGLGDVVPHGAIRLLTGSEALTGFVLITWSASFTFLEMQRFWKRD